MKNAIITFALLFGIGLMTACKNAPTNGDTDTVPSVAEATAIDTIPKYKETEDIYLGGEQTEYVMIFRSSECIENMLRNIGDDSAQLEDFYTAEDDFGYYYYLCCKQLEEMRVNYYETSADKKVLCQGDVVFQNQDSCTVGLLIVKPGCKVEFVDIMQFLFPPDSLGQ